MKRKISILALAGLSLLTTACFDEMFGPVEPIGPSVTTGEITNAAQTSFKISGTISEPGYKNDRERKKSGKTVEYGFAYGTSDNPAEGIIWKVGDTISTFPHTFNATINGLRANTTYKVWAYAKTEGGVMQYGNEAGQQTNDFPDPNPTINVHPIHGYRAPTNISFTTDDNTPGATYKWEFGTEFTSTAKNPTYTYKTGGAKTVKLTITANGKTRSHTTTVGIENPYTKATITRVKVLSFSELSTNGQPYDTGTDLSNPYLSGGPDMVIKGFVSPDATKSDSYTLYSDFKRTNVSIAQVNAGSIYWDSSSPGQLYSRTFSGDNLTSDLIILLLDWDSKDNFSNLLLAPLFLAQGMGEVKFKFSDYMTLEKKYPEVIQLQGNSDNALNKALKLEIKVKWE